VTVTVRYFAAARAAAGVSEERLTVPGPVDLSVSDVRGVPAGGVPAGGVPAGGVTVAVVLAEASDRHGPELARVLQRCSFLLDEVAVHGLDTVVHDGQLLDVLPPFAGG
jgi:molybdopterin converting factor small subunit